MHRVFGFLAAGARVCWVRILRLSVLLGIRTDPHAPTGEPGRSDHLNSAAMFKRLGDEALQISDLAIANDNHVAAIRLYSDSLGCACGPGGDPLATVFPGDLPAHGVSLEQVRMALRASVTDIAALDPASRKALARAMQQVCASIVDRLVTEADRSVTRMLARPVRVVLTVFMAVGLSSMAAYGWNAHANLARGKTWRASSTLIACRPIEKGGCPLREGVFFHTKEEMNPWIEYDLGRVDSFSRVVVENARDGLHMRAVPLIAEVGDDQESWREIARITTNFDEWATSFPPVKARYVRFRVPKLSYLHLARIEIRR